MSLPHGLGMSLPLIQAPMAGVQGAELAIAVSRAGGLGSLPCAMLSLEQLAQALESLRQSGVAHYNVNFFCHTESVVDPQTQAAWLQTLLPYYQALEVHPPGPIEAGSRRPFNQEALAVLQRYQPPVVSFHFGLPPADLLQAVRAWGAKIVCSATTLAEGEFLARQGVDAVIAQGLEAGGHRGIFLAADPIAALPEQMGLMALLPQLVKRLSVPVIAAGGIVQASTVRAVMAMGASAVQVGTSFLLCDEARTSPVHRAALQSQASAHTALTNLFTGRPARGIVNRLMRDLGPVYGGAPAFPLSTHALLPLRSRAEAMGCDDFSALWAGQNTSGCDTVSAATMTARLAQGFGPAGASE
jgi:nitronate monooxygenase